MTQVARADESYLYHDRLTHSLKVAQVASSLTRIIHQRHDIQAEYTEGREFPKGDSGLKTSLDPYVVEAAAHAHDIGHPPFGHAGEDELDSLVREYSKNNGSEKEIGFEGNAQSFRIVTRLADHRDPETGLNLTRATLNGMLKYPWGRDKNDSKWGYYPSDRAAFSWARRGLGDYRETGAYDDHRQTLEAQIMDYADDLTYAIHDLMDFYRAGLIPLHELFREAIDEGSNDSSTGPYEQYSVSSRDHLDKFEDYLDENTEVDPNSFDVAGHLENLAKELSGSNRALVTPFENTSAERQALSEFTSGLVERYVEAGRETSPEAVFVENEDGRWNLKKEEYIDEIRMLKAMTEFYVISNPTLMQQQHGQRRILRELFEALYSEANPKDLSKSIIPSPFHDWVKTHDDSPRSRIVADIISALTERQAVALHRRLCGDTPDALQNDIVG